MPWTNSSAFYTFLWTRTDIRIVLLTALMWKWHDNLFILLPEVFCFFHLFISMLHFVNGCVIFLVCEHRYLMWCNSFKFGAHQIVSVKVAQMISSISNSIVLSWHLNTSLSKLFLYFLRNLIRIGRSKFRKKLSKDSEQSNRRKVSLFVISFNQKSYFILQFKARLVF